MTQQTYNQEYSQHAINLTVIRGFNFSRLEGEGPRNFIQQITRQWGWQCLGRLDGQGRDSFAQEWPESGTAHVHAEQIRQTLPNVQISYASQIVGQTVR